MSDLPTALLAARDATTALATRLPCHACRRPPGERCRCELRIESALTLVRQATIAPWAYPRGGAR